MHASEIMYWPVLLHNSYLAIILCGLITISHATVDAQSQDTIIDSQRTAGGNSGTHTSSQYKQQHQQQQQQQQPQQTAPHHHQQQHNPHMKAPQNPSSQHQHYVTVSSQQQQQQHHHGSGGHNMDSIPRNSYTMLSQAMSQAVNHEFSK